MALGGATLAHANQTPTPAPSAGSTATQTPGQPGAKGAVPGTAKPDHDASLAAAAIAPLIFRTVIFCMSSLPCLDTTWASPSREPSPCGHHVRRDRAHRVPTLCDQLGGQVQVELVVGGADRDVGLHGPPGAVLAADDAGEPDRDRCSVAEGDQGPVREPADVALAVPAGGAGTGPSPRTG